MEKTVFYGNKLLDIKTRQNQTNKPKYYLYSSSENKYISSLYPTKKSGIYRFEYQGIYYLYFEEQNQVKRSNFEQTPKNNNKGLSPKTVTFSIEG